MKKIIKNSVKVLGVAIILLIVSLASCHFTSSPKNAYSVSSPKSTLVTHVTNSGDTLSYEEFVNGGIPAQMDLQPGEKYEIYLDFRNVAGPICNFTIYDHDIADITVDTTSPDREVYYPPTPGSVFLKKTSKFTINFENKTHGSTNFINRGVAWLLPKRVDHCLIYFAFTWGASNAKPLTLYLDKGYQYGGCQTDTNW